MNKEEVTIAVSKDILDFIDEMIEKRRFASVSHGFEFMAFEYMFREKEETPVEKLERFTLTGLSKTADFVRDTADKVQESSVMKTAKGSADKIKDSSLAKKVGESADKVKDSSVVKAMKESTDKVMESTLVKEVKGSVDKSTTKINESSLVKDIKESRVVRTMKKSAGKVRDAVSHEEHGEQEKLEKEKKKE